MIFSSEQALADFAKSFGLFLGDEKYLPLCIELVGDVGAGKTTFTRYLAQGLGVKSPITSPSFTISKHYFFSPESRELSADEKCDKHPCATSVTKTHDFELVHYDFYRLNDPGLMADDLAESLSDPTTITVLEWADSVANILPKDHPKISFKILPDGSRDLVFNQPMENLARKIERSR